MVDMARRKMVLVAGLLIAVLILAACGDGGAGSKGPVTISIWLGWPYMMTIATGALQAIP